MHVLKPNVFYLTLEIKPPCTKWYIPLCETSMSHSGMLMGVQGCHPLQTTEVTLCAAYGFPLRPTGGPYQNQTTTHVRRYRSWLQPIRQLVRGSSVQGFVDLQPDVINDTPCWIPQGCHATGPSNFQSKMARVTLLRPSYSRSRDGRASEIWTRDHKKTRFLGLSLRIARKISVARPSRDRL